MAKAPVRILNKYIVLEMLKSDAEIDYNCFYKRDIEGMLEILRKEYKRLLKEKEGEE